MTTVVENQNRPYGGMGFDSIYHHNLPHQGPPHFTDPWSTAHTSSHANPPIYSAAPVTPSIVKQEDVGRPTAVPMPYPGISVSAPPLVAGSNYTSGTYEGSDMGGVPHGLPRTSFDHGPPSYSTAPPMHNFASSYAPLSYSQSLHPHHNDARRLSNP